MEDLDLYLASRAHVEGRAQPRRRFRHVHLESTPLAIAMVQLASEPFAFWGALVGRRRSQPRLIVAPEPRNMSIALLAMTELAEVLCEYVDACRDGRREEKSRKNGSKRTTCLQAPQLMVANGAVVSLLDRVGRRMRTAGLSGKVTVPEVVNTAGAHLGYLAEAARRPGSSNVIVLTEVLARHWATGQSAFEDDHLGTQIAWHGPALAADVDPRRFEGKDPAQLSGREAAALIERTPMGVLTDPATDRDRLLDLVMTFNRERGGATDRKTVEELGQEIATELRQTLEPMWRALWTGYDLLNELKPAPSVADRWERDRTEFTSHADYIASGGRRRSVDSVKRAVMLLSDWEDAQTALVRAETLEDPIALVGALATGDALSGTVTAVDPDNTEPNPAGKKALKRPLLTYEIEEECPLPVGTRLWWKKRDRLEVELVNVAVSKAGGSTLTLKVVRGMNGELPTPNTTEVFTTLEPPRNFPRHLPREVPWTHTPDEDSETEAALDESPGLDEVIGSATAANA